MKTRCKQEARTWKNDTAYSVCAKKKGETNKAVHGSAIPVMLTEENLGGSHSKQKQCPKTLT